MAAGTRGAAVPIRPRSNSSRPGWVPRIMAPAPGIGPSRDWVDPGVRVAGPEICVVSIVGAWPHPNSGKRSNPRTDQKVEAPLFLRIALPLSLIPRSPEPVFSQSPEIGRVLSLRSRAGFTILSDQLKARVKPNLSGRPKRDKTPETLKIDRTGITPLFLSSQRQAVAPHGPGKPTGTCRGADCPGTLDASWWGEIGGFRGGQRRQTTMITISQGMVRTCTGVSRRDFLRVGGVGLGSFGLDRKSV